MKILMVNKFLHPKGGSERYMLDLGACLEKLGHEVQYFGMESPERRVGNRAEAYTNYMAFHGSFRWKQLTYLLKVIYSREARKKIRQVLEDFQPDVCHLNNFNYQLTPSVILEIRAWERKQGHSCRILYTAHDYQLVCPNHLCRNPGRGENCEKCLSGNYLHCLRGRCIHGSLARSLLGTMEAFFWGKRKVYRQIDTILCCSRFMKSRLDQNLVLREKTVVLHNFVEGTPSDVGEKQDYVLYVGRYAEEKGVADLLQAAKALPQIPFFFAGTGPMAESMQGIPNVTDLGFLSGDVLHNWIRQARLTVCPSRWQENCPLSVLESISLGTPVLGADIGGIPELIQPGKTGVLFESGNAEALKQSLLGLWEGPRKLNTMADCCREAHFDSPNVYAEKLLTLLKTR